MRQVPHYLILGNGRVARHFRHYFSLLNVPFETWYRAESVPLLKVRAQRASHILVLLSDDAIESFINTHLLEYEAIRIHCSGSLATSLAYGAHPLMSFTYDLYDLAEYQSIPFIVDDNAPDFSNLLPHLPNQYARLSLAAKKKYHALCVLSGNFSCLLWQKMFMSFETEFHLPRELAHPYLLRQMQNLLLNADTALTGPLVRNDQATISLNLSALTDDPFQMVYQSFVNCYQQLQKQV